MRWIFKLWDVYWDNGVVLIWGQHLYFIIIIFYYYYVFRVGLKSI
jgi:hypothetical protein